MKYHDALRVLVENSLVLSEQAKHTLLSKIPIMTQEEIMAWGKLLSREQDVLDDMVASEK